MNNKIRQQRCAISPVPGLKLIPVSLGGTIVAVTGGGGLSDASLVRAPSQRGGILERIRAKKNQGHQTPRRTGAFK
jgi:hypothetical protein